MPNPVKPKDDTGSILAAFRKLLERHTDDPADAQDHAAGGLQRKRTIDDAVDQAITGAKGANPDY